MTTTPPAPTPTRAPISIWWFAFGYFACYVPYSALTKALSDGLMPGMDVGLEHGLAPALDGRITGLMLLPISTMASLVGMFIFITVKGWWGFASKGRVFGVEIPRPGRWTFFSGVATAGIIATTTLSYSFSGVSIVFMMLLMRGGVLILAPLVDAGSGRKVKPSSWIALGLSLSALLVAFFAKGDAGTTLTTIAIIDVAIYLSAYFIRLRVMSRLAKSDDPDATKRYFVEEQMTATPVIVAFLAIFALVMEGGAAEQLSLGFTSLWGTSQLVWIVLLGLLSQGTGIFGALILLDKRENSFCVPVNRASSILAGLFASFSLTLIFEVSAPGASELIGAVLVIAAMLVLSLPGPLARARARRAAGN